VRPLTAFAYFDKPMATATQQPKITFCPPGPHRPELETKQHVQKFHFPVSAEVQAGGEWESSCLDFGDYGRMSTMLQKLEKGRRNERPDWAVNNVQLSKVIATYLENRAALDRSRRQPGTLAERIKRAQVAIKSQLPNKIEILDGLSKEYVELKRSPAATCDRLRELEIQIEGLDTFIRTSQEDGGLLLVVGVVQTYWKEGLNSVECAERLRIKPPHVRQIVWRLDKAWKKVSTEVRLPMHINVLRGLRTNPFVIPGKRQRRCWVCGCLFYPAVKGPHTDACRKRRCVRKEKERLDKSKKHGPQKVFCGPACKDAARFAIKSLPVPVKPGVGLFVPIAGGDRYQNYLKFCMVVGTTPLDDTQWRMGIR
jgi:hypothetical protein